MIYDHDRIQRMISAVRQHDDSTMHVDTAYVLRLAMTKLLADELEASDNFITKLIIDRDRFLAERDKFLAERDTYRSRAYHAEEILKTALLLGK